MPSSSSPLLAAPRTYASDANAGAEPASLGALVRANNMRGSALAVQGAALALMALVWQLVLSKMGGKGALPLFAWHPMVQSLGLVLLVQSILVLQPTSTPAAKATALNVHQLLNLFLVLPLFTAGAWIMWHLHEQSGAHFISWHGTFGAVCVVWAWLQAAVGAASVWGGGALLGGGSRAKAVWKWHRLSGYLLLPVFILTFVLAILETTWVRQNASTSWRTFGVLALGGVLLGGALRVRPSKLPKLF